MLMGNQNPQNPQPPDAEQGAQGTWDQAGQQARLGQPNLSPTQNAQNLGDPLPQSGQIRSARGISGPGARDPALQPPYSPQSGALPGTGASGAQEMRAAGPIVDRARRQDNYGAYGSPQQEEQARFGRVFPPAAPTPHLQQEYGLPNDQMGYNAQGARLPVGYGQQPGQPMQTPSAQFPVARSRGAVVDTMPRRQRRPSPPLPPNQPRQPQAPSHATPASSAYDDTVPLSAMPENHPAQNGGALLARLFWPRGAPSQEVAYWDQMGYNFGVPLRDPEKSGSVWLGGMFSALALLFAAILIVVSSITGKGVLLSINTAGIAFGLVGALLALWGTLMNGLTWVAMQKDQ